MTIKVTESNNLKVHFEIISINNLPKIPVQSRVDRKSNPLSRKIPNKGGLYFLFYEDLRLLYIGKAKNIRQRLNQHLQPRTVQEIAEHKRKNPKHIFFVSYIVIDNNFERDVFETTYLNTYGTAWNIFNIDNSLSFPEEPEDKELERKDVKAFIDRQQSLIDDAVESTQI